MQNAAAGAETSFGRTGSIGGRRGFANLEHDTRSVARIKIAEARLVLPAPSGDNVQAHCAPFGFRRIAIGHFETEVVNTFAVLLEEPSLRGVLGARLAKLQLEIVAIDTSVAHRIRRLFVRHVEVDTATHHRVT